MKIAILMPNMVEFDGGAQHVRVMADNLVQEGHEVTVITFSTDMTLKNIEIIEIGMPKNQFMERVYRLLFPLDLWKTLRWLPVLKSFDEVIACYYPLTWLACLSKVFFGNKYVFRYSGIMNPDLLPHFYEKIYMWLHIYFTKITTFNVDKSISVSKFAQAELLKYLSIDSVVVHDAIDKKMFSLDIDGAKIREKYNLNGNNVLLSVSAVRPVKGFHLLIQVYRIIKRSVPNVKLIIIGKATFGYYMDELKKMSDDSVIFIDYVPNSELPEYYAACDLYVTCSLWETFNRPLVEAQCCGKAVVAFNIGSHPEVINEQGTLVEKGNIKTFAEECIKRLKTNITEKID